MTRVTAVAADAASQTDVCHRSSGRLMIHPATSPKIAPAITSVTKCDPLNIRLNATNAAAPYQIHLAEG